MLGSPILDVAIGMAFVYLLLSLIASAIQELLSSLVESRSANLYNGIRSLLSGDTRMVKLLYSHGLIAGLYRNPEQDFAGLGRSWFTHLRTALQPILGIRRIAPPAADEFTSDPLLLPAYIPARTFALALMDILNESKTSGWELMEGIRQTLASASTEVRAGAAVQALALRAGDDPEAFQTYLEDWYNDTMDRVSGWYKQYVQNMLLIVAVLLSITFNVDSIRIGRTLWIEPTLRQTLTSAADAYIRNPPPPTQPPRHLDRLPRAEVPLRHRRLQGGEQQPRPPRRLAPHPAGVLGHPPQPVLAPAAIAAPVSRRLAHHRLRPVLRRTLLVRHPQPLHDRPRNRQASRKEQHRTTQGLKQPHGTRTQLYAVISTEAKRSGDTPVFVVACRSPDAWHTALVLRPGVLKGRDGEAHSAPCPFSFRNRSSPNFGDPLVPLTHTGISAPAPCLWKNGSSGFSSHDFHHDVTICESFASVRTLPSNWNCSPSSVYTPLSSTVAPGILYRRSGNRIRPSFSPNPLLISDDTSSTLATASFGRPCACKLSMSTFP